MRVKYAEETFGYWFVHGIYPDGDVDLVSEGQNNKVIFDGNKVNKDTAEFLAERYNALVTAIGKMDYETYGKIRDFWTKELAQPPITKERGEE